jgi:hypothetical protein
MANYREIQNLKQKLLDEIDVIDKKSQYGLEIHFEYKYLLNTDIDWIIYEIRKSIIKSLKKNFPDIYNKERKRLVLTFRIYQAETKHSLLLVIVTGIISGVLSNIITDLMKTGFNDFRQKVKDKKTNIDKRHNLEQIDVRPINIENKKIQYDDEKPIVIKRDYNRFGPRM